MCGVFNLQRRSTLVDGTSLKKKYHKVGVGRNHGDNTSLLLPKTIFFLSHCVQIQAETGGSLAL